ncbi:MAG: 4Fe-4S binding protein, partial [Deltaproteobacteria bacterium]|nr:4Fe-4S binding protein [Deltaproteobacteria bacterium]
MSIDERYRQVAEMVSGGAVSPTLVEIFGELVEEDQLDLLLAFKEMRSQSLDQLKESSGMGEDVILEQTSALAKKGLIFNQPNSKGVKVFRLLPLANVGVFEYTFMRKLTGSEEEKKLAGLFTKLFGEQRAAFQPTEEQMAAMLARRPAPDRTMPIPLNKATGNPTVIEINTDLGPVEERILLTQNVKDLIDKFDEIAVGYCFCRQHKDTEGHHCEQTDLRETCFTFGKSARFTTDNGFMRMIDKDEALEILLKSEEDGLVHKAYHPNFDTSKPETSICNCCKDCCGNSRGAIVNVASYLASVNPELCVGCEICAERCHPAAIALGDDGVSHVDEERCFGCGVCAYFCPENAIQLTETPSRIVRVAAR